MFWHSKLSYKNFSQKKGNGDSFLADWLRTNLNTFLKRACLGLPTGPLACGHLGKKFFFIWGQSQIFEKNLKKTIGLKSFSSKRGAKSKNLNFFLHNLKIYAEIFILWRVYFISKIIWYLKTKMRFFLEFATISSKIGIFSISKI